MRKIENLTDWTKFIGDARFYARDNWEDTTIYFAVSKNGDNWDGQATIEYRPAPYKDYWSYLNWQDVASAYKDMSPRAFYADIVELLGGESFYICDTGANYKWL